MSQEELFKLIDKTLAENEMEVKKLCTKDHVEDLESKPQKHVSH